MKNLLQLLPNFLIFSIFSQSVNSLHEGNPLERDNGTFIVRINIRNHGSEYFCTGTLLSNRWVITAAHPIKNADSITIVTGTVDTNNYYDEYRQIFKPERVIIHDEYSEEWTNVKGTRDGDVALIKLKGFVQPNKYVRIVKLPCREYRIPFSEEEQYMMAWGWGMHLMEMQSSQLRNQRVRIRPKKDCQILFYNTIHNWNVICAYGLLHMSILCDGDSGGPLTLHEDNTDVLVGVATYFQEPCSLQFPSMFVSIDYYLKWIEKETGIALKSCSHAMYSDYD